MTDESELTGLDPYQLFDTEVARVARHFRGLDDDGWNQPTRCEGWRAREMLSHLRGCELYNGACVDNAVPDLMERASKEGGVTDLDSFNRWVNEIYAPVDTTTLVDEWQAAAEAFGAELRRRGDGGELSTMVGPYPARLQAFHLAQEYATHADDMGAAVADGEADARRDWRARVTRFVLTEMDKPVEIERHQGRNVVRAAGTEMELSDDDLVEAGQGRLPREALPETIADALRVNG